MDLSYPLILENTDLQQAAELNSTRNVKMSDVNLQVSIDRDRDRSIGSKDTICSCAYYQEIWT
jgi:hypothetical protein